MSDNAYEVKMGKTLVALQSNFSTIRAGRANASILDRITVEYYGTPTALSAVATISTPDPRMIMIQPWDAGLLKAIEKAIQSSDIGINPQNDGKVIRLAFPQLTEERRKELVKQVHKYAEEAKIALRNIRREAMDEYKAQKKRSDITEDDFADLEVEIQKITDKKVGEVDKMTAEKEKELISM